VQNIKEVGFDYLVPPKINKGDWILEIDCSTRPAQRHLIDVACVSAMGPSAITLVAKPKGIGEGTTQTMIGCSFMKALKAKQKMARNAKYFNH
jgi:hypothetical protein